jgi:hypothetical protein
MKLLFDGPNHFLGDITFLDLFLFNQAPHQEKDELAIMLSLHKDIKYKSS